MPKTYRQISADEMRGFLKMEKGWIESIEGAELVFKFNLNSCPNVQVKVFSSIKIKDETGRDVGKDSIKICATKKISNNAIIGWIKASRVYRTTNWQENLKNAIFEVIKQSKLRR